MSDEELATAILDGKSLDDPIFRQLADPATSQPVELLPVPGVLRIAIARRLSGADKRGRGTPRHSDDAALERIALKINMRAAISRMDPTWRTISAERALEDIAAEHGEDSEALGRKLRRFKQKNPGRIPTVKELVRSMTEARGK